MTRKKFYITTPIYYVNAPPHIGHAYTGIIADIIARFKSSAGFDMKFLTGTDEHGQKVEKSALDKAVDIQEFVDENAQNFEHLAKICNLSHSDFIRTTEKRHKDRVKKFWKTLEDSGNIYLGNYEGWYSTRDEAFYSEKEITKDKLAPTGSPVEWVSEPSYFFRLSNFENQLLKFYEDNPDFIKPAGRMNEIKNFVRDGLQDLSISRTSFSWGIKSPPDDNHVIYVWLDALTNYISALEENEQDFWPADLHVVGKDILRFHAVYWPAFLMAAKMDIPKNILAHGWWTNKGEKISKSLGNTIDPINIEKLYGIDAMRFFLAREITVGNDGSFSEENLIARYNSELANKIGNLLQRVASFAYKNFGGKIPEITQNELEEIYSQDLVKKAINLNDQSKKLIKNYSINEILQNIINLAQDANIYIDSNAPWQLIKEDKNKAGIMVYMLLEVIRYIAINLRPYVPESAEKMLAQLGVDSSHIEFEHLSKKHHLTPGAEITKPEPIFMQILPK